MSDNNLYSPEQLRGLELPKRRSFCVAQATENVAKQMYVDPSLLQQMPVNEGPAPVNDTAPFVADSVETAQQAVATALVRNPHA